jgi:hypothetical protein
MAGDWSDVVEPVSPAVAVTAAHVTHGPLIPPQQQLLLYSPDQWEDFVQEWLHYCLKKAYKKVQRFSGPGDMGIDVAGFTDAKMRLMGVWDNYQCKHYDQALKPADAWPEIGKIIWYSFMGEYLPPRHYFFVAPKGANTALSKLLSNGTKLREELIANWDKKVKNAITKTQSVLLDTDLLDYVNAFDFSIFDAKTSLQLVDDHRKSPVHAARFGGGLKPRPAAKAPPASLAPNESRYVTHLLGAYAEHTGKPVPDLSALTVPVLRSHFHRQREAFYQAEALRVFARDSVPEGTFESLQQDIFDGVIDTHDAAYPDGYQKVCAVTKAAREVQITANALITCTQPKDRDGICHQLVNEERLRWTK